MTRPMVHPDFGLGKMTPYSAKSWDEVLSGPDPDPAELLDMDTLKFFVYLGVDVYMAESGQYERQCAIEAGPFKTRRGARLFGRLLLGATAQWVLNYVPKTDYYDVFGFDNLKLPLKGFTIEAVTDECGTIATEDYK